jgi:Mg2+ and Co2+ transporter CorA
VKNMEGIPLEEFPANAWVAGLVVLALMAAVTLYGWWSDELSHPKAERPALKKAA